MILTSCVCPKCKGQVVINPYTLDASCIQCGNERFTVVPRATVRV